MKLVALVLVSVCTLAFAKTPGAGAAAAKKAPTKTEKTATKSLAERLGGYPAISAVVDDFVARVGADKKINHFFAKTDLSNLKKQLKDQICEAAGGFYDDKKTEPKKLEDPKKDPLAAERTISVSFDGAQWRSDIGHRALKA